MNTNNLMLLQKQHLKPLKIMTFFTDGLWALLVLFLWFNLEGELIFMFSWLLVVLLIINLVVLEAVKPSASLKRLPPDVLRTVNVQCLTGLRFGNGILCDNDCLVVIGRVMVTVVMLKDITRMELRTVGKGVIFLEGTDAPYNVNVDPHTPWGLQGLIMSNNRNRGMINGAERRVKGTGTFREADRDTFWRALCGTWKKYSDTEPIIS